MAGGRISASYDAPKFTLREGNYRAAIGHNIKAMKEAGVDNQKQRVAIALGTARGSSMTGKGPGSRSESRVAYMKGLTGKTYSPRKSLRQAGYKAGSAARAGARPVFHYPGVAPFGPGMKPYGKGTRPTPAAKEIDGSRVYYRDNIGRFARKAA